MTVMGDESGLVLLKPERAYFLLVYSINNFWLEVVVVFSCQRGGIAAETGRGSAETERKAGGGYPSPYLARHAA